MTRSPQLTDTQLILLVTASQRDDGSLLPPPDSLNNRDTVPMDRIRSAVARLIKRSLASEVDVADVSRSWRTEGDRYIGAIINQAGRTIIAVDPEPHDAPLKPIVPGDVEAATAPATPTALNGAGAPNLRPGTKLALVVDLLRSDAGASIGELTGTTGWLPHTTRAALTGLRKRGFTIAGEKAEGETRYHITAGSRRP